MNLSTITLSVILSTVAFAGETTETHKAMAYEDVGKKKLLYTEEHKAIYKAGVVVRSTNDYFDPNGKKIAELNSDYSKSQTMPVYQFKDLRTGRYEGLRYTQQGYQIYKKSGDNKKEEVSALKSTSGMFAGQGWHYYLRSRLTNLNKDPLKMKLVFPGKLDYYSFQIRTLGNDQETIKLRLEFDSWIIRLVAPHLDLTYNKSKKKLVYYHGPSNLDDFPNVHIYYH